MKNFKRFVLEGSLINNTTSPNSSGYQSPEENKKIATNIINTITPELQKAGFQIKTDLSGQNQTPNLEQISKTPDFKLLLITTDFSKGWDGHDRSGGIKVYVNKNNLESLKQSINKINHPFVRMGDKAYYYMTQGDTACLIIYDDGVNQQPAL